MPQSKINFHFQAAPFYLPKRKRLKFFIEQIFKAERKELESLDYIFCTDEYLFKINQQYLQHNDYTDIISFDLSNSKASSGEIYISIERVRENAAQFKTSIKSEIHRVVFHGALHLCGYKDKIKADKQIMTQKEDYYLQAYLK